MRSLRLNIPFFIAMLIVAILACALPTDDLIENRQNK